MVVRLLVCDNFLMTSPTNVHFVDWTKSFTGVVVLFDTKSLEQSTFSKWIIKSPQIMRIHSILNKKKKKKNMKRETWNVKTAQESILS